MIDFLKSFLLFNENEPLIFTGLMFWIFFGITLILYSVVYKRGALRNAFLFGVSLFFYYKTGGGFVTLLLFSTVTDFFIGHAIFKAHTLRRKKVFLALSMVLNLGLLVYFKYAYFFADSFNALFGSQFHPINHFAALSNEMLGTGFRVDKILLPVGVSFFTFQTMSYAIDVYRGHVQPVKNILDFGFYVSFFPQLVAGPIVRASEFIPQLYKPYRLSKLAFGLAIFWILNGLLKKIFLSDFLAVRFMDRVFENPGSFTGFENLMALYGYSLQVYADFSGYTDMAIGLAMLLGFRLPKNFDSPYKAHSTSDFWKRWHISLSTWLKDYLYIPMGGNRGGTLFTFIALGVLLFFIILASGSKLTIYLVVSLAILLGVSAWLLVKFRKWLVTNINMLLTMLLGGLWHGAGWNFVIWGGLNGFGLLFFKLWNRISPWKNKKIIVNRVIGIFLTFNFISFTRIWFRSGSKNTWTELNETHDISSELDTANTMLSQLTTRLDFSIAPQVLAGYSEVFWVLLLGFVIHWLPSSWKKRYRYSFAKSHPALQITAVMVAIILVWQVMQAGTRPFIYFQF